MAAGSHIGTFFYFVLFNLALIAWQFSCNPTHLCAQPRLAICIVVEARPDHIAIDERLGPEADDLMAIFREVGLGYGVANARIEHHLKQAASCAPVLRFRLQDCTRRLFGVERVYLGGDDEWLLLEATGPIEDLARQVVPLLGTKEFFELW